MSNSEVPSCCVRLAGSKGSVWMVWLVCVLSLFCAVSSQLSVRLTHPGHGQWIQPGEEFVEWSFEPGLDPTPVQFHVLVETGSNVEEFVVQSTRLELTRCEFGLEPGGHIVSVAPIPSENVIPNKVGYFVDKNIFKSASPRATAHDRLVEQHYTLHPYPHATPLRLPADNPADGRQLLLLINHYIFGGQFDFQLNQLRFLFAGGSVGDEALAVMSELAMFGHPDSKATVLDISEPALQTGRQSALNLGLQERVEFVQGSILDLEGALEGQMFDVVVCTGVLHHMSDAEEGLRALAHVTAPDGGLVVMVYGDIARSGVYHLQEALRLLNPIEDPIRTARALVQNIPSSTPLSHSVHLSRQLKALTDAENMHGVSFNSSIELADTLLHPRDHPMGIHQVFAMARGAHLSVGGVWKLMQYNVLTHISDEDLKDSIRGLAQTEQLRVAEILLGNIQKHFVYLTHMAQLTNDNGTRATARWDDSGSVPCFLKASLRAQIAKQRKDIIRVTVNGLAVALNLPDSTRTIIKFINNVRSVGEISQMYSQTAFAETTPFTEAWQEVGNLVRRMDWVVVSNTPSGLCPELSPLQSAAADEMLELIDWLKERPVLGIILLLMCVIILRSMSRFRIRVKPQHAHTHSHTPMWKHE